MELLEVFQILEIEATKDERAIKNAYRNKLAVTNPEDDPEGFKRLRAAFEAACQYAKTSDEEEAPQEERDETPSGLWVEKFARIYDNIKTRQDVTAWDELFKEDVFLSLEEEENCRLKLIKFLLNHFKLPTDVWNLLNEKLSLTKDMQQLKEYFPQDFLRYVVFKCDRGEDLDFTLFEGPEDGQYDQFIYYYEGCVRAMNQDNLNVAKEQLACADALGIIHPYNELSRAQIAEKEKETAKAVEIVQALREKYPKDGTIAFQTAELLWRNAYKKQAAAIYEELKAEKDDHYSANWRLSEYYYEGCEYKKAKKCAEQVLNYGVQPEFSALLDKINAEIEKDLEKEYEETGDVLLGMELCWCYLQDGKNSKGIRTALPLEKKMPREKEAEYNGLLTKLYAELAEYETTVAMAEVMEASLREKIATGISDNIEKDRNRIGQSYSIRLRCYRNMGFRDKAYWDTAAKLYENAEEEVREEIGVKIEVAYIYLEMGEYEKCLEITENLIEKHQIYAAHAPRMDAYRRQWNAGGVIQESRFCQQYFPEFVRSYEFAAKVYLDLKRPDDLKYILNLAQQNNVKSPILEAYAYQMEHEIPESNIINEKLKEFRTAHYQKVSKGDMEDFEESLKEITEYLYMYPGSYMLVERGYYYRLAHKMQEAAADYEKAVVEDPGYCYAYNGLQVVYRVTCEYEKALTVMNKAIYYAKGDMEQSDYAKLFATRGDIYSLLGDYEMALASYKQFLIEFGEEEGRKNQYYMGKMATCQMRCGLHEEAVETIKFAFGADSLDAYKEIAEMYIMTHYVKKETKASVERKGQYSGMTEQVTYSPKEQIKKHFSAWKSVLFALDKNSDKVCRHFEDYYSQKAWYSLVYGTKAQAVADFDTWIHYKKTGNKEGALCDGIIAALLCGDEMTARKWSEELKSAIEQRMMNKEQSLQAKAQGTRASQTDPDYINRQKGKLQRDILSTYFEKTAEEIDAMLDSESGLEICHFCTFHLCKELEGLRVMHLLHTGRVEEAKARLEHNLKVQPYDEYMLGCKHMGFEYGNGSSGEAGKENPLAEKIGVAGEKLKDEMAQQKVFTFKNMLRIIRLILRGLK